MSRKSALDTIAPAQAQHFTASEALCLLTMFPVAECEHCQCIAERPPGPAVVVTEVDREDGVIEVEALGANLGRSLAESMAVAQIASNELLRNK